MALANFVISGRPNPALFYPARSGQQRVSVFGNHVDGFSEEQHDKSVQITENPIESGSTVTDSAVTNPDHLRLEGLVSDLIPAAGELPDNLSDRSALAWGIIQDMADNHQVVEVTTGITTYPTMLLSTASTTRNSKTGGGLKFTLNLKSLRIVDTEVRTVRLQPENVRDPITDRTTTADAGEKDSPDTEGEDIFLPFEPYDTERAFTGALEDTRTTQFLQDMQAYYNTMVNGVYKAGEHLTTVVNELLQEVGDSPAVRAAIDYFTKEVDIFQHEVDSDRVFQQVQGGGD